MGEPRVAAATVTDRRLVAMKPGRLAAVAMEFAREHARLHGDFERESRVLTGEAYWPLMPTDFLAANGAYRIVALTSRAALIQQGVGMSLCLRGGGELANRVAACAQARLFLVAVVDATLGTTRSVAEFRIHQPFRGGRFDLELIQHKAFANNTPSIACRKALHELMAHAQSREIQDHLEAGRRLVQQRNGTIPEVVRAAEHAIVVEALQTAMGAALLDAAVQQVAKAAASSEGWPAVTGGSSTSG